MKPLNEMTAKELIAYVEYALPKRNPDSILDALYTKLKEAITPNPDEIAIKWCTDRDKLKEAITPVNTDQERELHYLVHADYSKKQ